MVEERQKPAFSWSAFANPNRFMRITGYILPVAAVLAFLLFAIGLYLALWVVPSDFKPGDAGRIIFVHVPAAAMSIIVYSIMVLCSIASLIWKHPIADLSAKAAAPVGASFTMLALITGAVWGKPMWGTWWVWDARLTSELILFFFYLGYMALWDAFDERERAAPAAAIFCIVGSVFAVLAKYSVLLWDTLHQGPSMTIGGEQNLSNEFHRPLLIMLAAFYTYFLTVWLLRVRSEIRQVRIRRYRESMVQE